MQTIWNKDGIAVRPEIVIESVRQKIPASVK